MISPKLPTKLGTLAIADPARDEARELYTQRLCQSVPRVTRRLAALCGGEVAGQMDAWRNVFAALPPEEAERTVAHPFFSYYWLQLMKGCQQLNPTYLAAWSAHLGRFLILPALRNGLPLPSPLRLPVDSGQLRFPGELWHVSVSSPTVVTVAEITDDGDGSLRNGAISIPPGFLLTEGQQRIGSVTRECRPVLDGTIIEVDSGDPWINHLLASMNTKPAAPGYPPPDLHPMTAVTKAQLSDLASAFALVKRVWPALATEIGMYVKLLVPYRSSFHSSFTEACMMGAVFLSEAMWPFSSDVFTAEHLLHEVAHLRLTLIWEADPLIEAGRAADYNSPWRRDPRPMSGLVQAIFAFGRIAGFHRRAYALTGDARHEARHAESARLLAAGMKELQDGPALHFTEAGERLWADLLLEAAA